MTTKPCIICNGIGEHGFAFMAQFSCITCDGSGELCTRCLLPSKPRAIDGWHCECEPKEPDA